MEPNGPGQAIFDLLVFLGAAAALFLYVIRPIWRALTGAPKDRL